MLNATHSIRRTAITAIRTGRRFMSSNGDTGATLPERQKKRAEEQIRKWLQQEKERKAKLPPQPPQPTQPTKETKTN